MNASNVSGNIHWSHRVIAFFVLGGTFKSLLVPHSWNEQLPTARSHAESSVQPDLDCLWGWSSCYISGQPILDLPLPTHTDLVGSRITAWANGPQCTHATSLAPGGCFVLEHIQNKHSHRSLGITWVQAGKEKLSRKYCSSIFSGNSKQKIFALNSIIPVGGISWTNNSHTEVCSMLSLSLPPQGTPGLRDLCCEDISNASSCDISGNISDPKVRLKGSAPDSVIKTPFCLLKRF